MALTRTYIFSGGTNTDGTSFTTSSQSPTANALLLLYIRAHDDSGSPSSPTSITGTNWANGLTWALECYIDVAHVAEGGVTRHMIYSATSPGSITGGTITANFAVTHENYAWQLETWTEDSGPIPEVLQSKVNSAVADATVTLDIVPSAISGSWAMGAVAASANVVFSPGLTDGDTNYTYPPIWVQRSGYTISSPPTAATADSSSTTANVAAMYMEIGQAATGHVVNPLGQGPPQATPGTLDPLGF